MVFGPLASNPPHQLDIGNLTVDRVAHTVHGVRNDSQPVTEMEWTRRERLLKAEQTVVLLKQLKQAGMSTVDLLCFYKSVIRPVTEYACPAWHTSLTVEHSNRIESFKKRALKIIYNDFTSGDSAYTYNCILADLPQLVDRQEQLTKRLFVKMVDSDKCLNYLLSAKRDSEIISSLRTAKEYPLICAKSIQF